MMSPTLPNLETGESKTVLSAHDLLSGSQIIHEIQIPAAILTPHTLNNDFVQTVRIRPLSLATITVISKAARDDASLVPVLMVKEAVVEPVLSFDQVRQMQIGLVHYLVSQINRVSGLGTDGSVMEETLNSPLGQTHWVLAQHFGWTPDQVSQLTPAQVAVYLAGIERFLNWADRGGES